MAVEAPARLAEQEVDAFNRGDWDTMARLYGEHGVYHEIATGQHLEGADQIAAAFEAWRDAFPDARGTITNSVSAGGQVIQEVTWQGTQDGVLRTSEGSIPASGKQVTIYAVQVLQSKDGQIQEHRHYFDMLGMLQQIGAEGYLGLPP
jgi:steroid delta-isomerase-like uncharacterized protein